MGRDDYEKQRLEKAPSMKNLSNDSNCLYEGMKKP
jgi:hypothetical protein